MCPIQGHAPPMRDKRIFESELDAAELIIFFPWRETLNRSTVVATIELLGYRCRVAFNWEGPDSG
ncbi:hypothetical protein BCD67_01765 [Oscillatoriales cyanobacterium USR001]|nr:hypothetical protein BCD67_01765 [Oscillatoriales cyanobacterium USR001]